MVLDEDTRCWLIITTADPIGKWMLLHPMKKKQWALLFMFAIKMMVEEFSACCCFHYIVMSFKIMTEYCFEKNSKQKKNAGLENT